MIFIVGLGNPGLKYKKTRHNIGFMVLDELQKQENLPKFKLQKKLLAEICQGQINGQDIILAKPQTYMNSSGKSVKMACLKFKVYGLKLIIVHDDFDLPLGEIKTSENSSAGGHHGVQSIIDALKSQNFKRLRIGIRPVLQDRVLAGDFVLKKFTSQEKPLLNQAIKNACAELQKIILR